MENYSPLGAMLISEARKRSRLTQDQRADRAGVSCDFIQKLESGTTSISLETVISYLQLMNLDLVYHLVPLDNSDLQLLRVSATPRENWIWHKNIKRRLDKLRNAVVVDGE